MKRRTFLAGGTAALVAPSTGHGMAAKTFPPVPAWKPAFGQPIERIVDRFAYYFDQKRDFAVLKNGTCVLVDDGLSDADAVGAALARLDAIINFHPDMNPMSMDDGNILIEYSEPAFTVALEEVAQAHWAEIEARHLDGLAADEVLITPMGQNVFDDFGKKALWGRCYMFMDAQAPEVVAIQRRKKP